ncbi:MAG: rod shape-determining protein MreC [bacterium]|nr:rod shape-determining protein MreC [bacterium]
MDAYLNKQKTVLFKVLFGLIFLFVFFVTLNLFPTQIKNSFYFVSKPIERIFWKTGGDTSNFFKSFLNAGNLEKENESLKIENQKLLSEVALLQDTQKKEQAVESFLANYSQDNFKLVLAGVIGLNTDLDVISIDKGSADGILEGMPVINQQKLLFGKVFKVYENFSEVILISNKNNILDVKIQQTDPTKNPIYGAIKGKGGLDIYLDLVPTDEEIKEGDVLVTSALEGAFPKDLLVGKITGKDKNDQKPFQTAEVEPFFNIKGAENLFIITDYKR